MHIVQNLVFVYPKRFKKKRQVSKQQVSGQTVSKR